MNNKLLLIGGLLVAGAIGAFLLLRKPGLPGMTGGNAETMSATLAQLLTMGQDYSCTFESTDETTGATSNGTVYVADDGTKMNGAFKMKDASGVETDSYMISDGQYTYIWSSAQEQGFKMKVDPEADSSLFPETEDGDSEEMGFDENEQMDFNCQPWRPNNSLFVPPTDIEFIDFSAQLEMMEAQLDQVPQGTGTTNCAICDQAPAGEARTQCLAAMGC